LRLFFVDYREGDDGEEAAEGCPDGLDGVYYEGEGGGIVFVYAEDHQGGDYHKMPGADASLYRDGYGDTAHGKGDQADSYAQVAREIEGVKGNIEEKEIAAPNQEGLNDEKNLFLQYPDAFHAFQDIVQYFFGFLYQGKMSEAGEGKPNGGNYDSDSRKYPEQAEILTETFQQFGVPGEEFMEEGDIEHKNKAGKEAYRKGIGYTIYQKRPDQFGKRDFLIFRNNAATPYFAYTGKHVINRIIAQHGVDYIDRLKPFSYRIDK
jgi:hypothetical protein